MTINELLKSRYVKYGRDYPCLDCYGLVRLAKAELFGGSEMPFFTNIDPMDKRRLTEATIDVRDQGEFQEVCLRVGAIATAWRGSLCVHVGIVVEVDGRLWILETDIGTGPTLTRPSAFLSRFSRVIFYDN